MNKNDQIEKLDKNYDQLDKNKKKTLLLIGEYLLRIQNMVKNEKLRKKGKVK